MGKQTDKIQQKEKQVIFQSYFRPITPDFEEESCQYCSFCEQDIDTYPCAKCHTPTLVLDTKKRPRKLAGVFFLLKYVQVTN